MLPTLPKALLALADGAVWHGYSVGAEVTKVGEVVFNTALTGYQEILTDPSYSQQIVTLTYPHIGSYGVSQEDEESRAVWAAGLVVKDLPNTASNFRATESLGDYLKRSGLGSIAGIDTRRLTRHLRTHGAQSGCLMALPQGQAITPALQAQAIALAQGFAGLAGMDLAKQVSVDAPYTWSQTSWKLGTGYGQLQQPLFKVVAYDFGIKYNILRLLAERGCQVTVVPAQTSAADVFKLHPDGVFLSNGPGDPEPCDYAINAAREFLARGLPIFGICLGHQILSLACGAQTYKMKFGHHGANHPVRDLQSGRVSITSQNHGFAVDEKTLPSDLEITHISLFDNTVQGIRHKHKPAFAFQGHPEASPGPHDIGYLFDRFTSMMAQSKTANTGSLAATQS